MLAALLGTMARPREGAHGGRSGRGLAAPASALGGRHRWLVASSERSRRRWLVAPAGITRVRPTVASGFGGPAGQGHGRGSQWWAGYSGRAACPRPWRPGGLLVA